MFGLDVIDLLAAAILVVIFAVVLMRFYRDGTH